MTRIQRRLLIDTSVIGITLTLCVAILDFSTRILQPLDDWCYDRRARACQYFTPPPTDKLVHVDIDDASLETLGKWPWHRTVLAELIDEIEHAGPKAIALDIFFPDPEQVRIEEKAPGQFLKVEDDANFVSAVRRGGNVLVPASLNLAPSLPPIYKKMRDYLVADLELTEADCYKRLLADPDKLLSEDQKFPADLFITARRDAMNARISAELSDHPELSFDDLRARLLPKTDPAVTGSPRFNALAEEYRKALAVIPLRRFMIPIPPGISQLARFDSELAPIPELSRVAAASGYVDYLQRDEGNVIRSIPLWVNYRGELFPQMDLSLACAVLGVDLRNVKLSPDQVVIPKPPGRDADIIIPVRSKYSPTFGRDVGMIMDIPSRGRADWETIYDHRRYSKPELHVPIPFIWEVHTIRERIGRNSASIDRAISTILNDDAPYKLALDPAKAKGYAAKLPGPEDTAARREIVQWTLGQLKESGMLELIKMKDEELEDKPDDLPFWIRVPPAFWPILRGDKPDKRQQRDELIIANNALATLLDQNKRFEEILGDRRQQLKDRIQGRAVLIGWAASGGIDFFPTPIQPRCPGVVIHGLVFNAIMTGEFWRHAPKWVTTFITILIGFLVTAANGFFKPSIALIAAVLVGIAYLLINGLLLFDYGNWCVGVAGPIVALASVWSTGALAGFLIEAAERARITKRFSSYVDQKLVDHVIENPDAALDGQVREMTVIFTDLAGFTALSEQLRERTVPILSEYLGLMVPIIRKNDGLVNKFLGDGIMCFYGAPKDNPNHAPDAVKTCLEMQKTMKQFADALVAQGLPRLSMRCGVSSGNMVVGDSGPADAADYTVLGDCVNFAARLEGANKVTGTGILISERTSELLGDRFLLRPVGRLLVVGKTHGVMTFEPIAAIDEATLDDRLCVASSAEMIAAYVARDFKKCIEVADQMDKQFGPTHLPALYRKTAQQYLLRPPGPEFNGDLILTEK